MEAKKIEQAPDPTLQLEKQRAEADQVKQLQLQASADTSNLMARYGTRLALAGVGQTTQAVTGAGPAGR